MQVLRKRQFEKRVSRLPAGIRRALVERLRLFMADPQNPLLNNHPLRGEWTGFRSINVTGDWRLIYEMVGDAIVLTDIDTHHNLYGT
ncbi:MAG: type II toxin-antitoxin system mRNA interferase toxin, RelE/StbE family [bacterium]